MQVYHGARTCSPLLMRLQANPKLPSGCCLGRFKITRATCWHKNQQGARGINLPAPFMSAGYLLKCFLMNACWRKRNGWNVPSSKVIRAAGLRTHLQAPAIQMCKQHCDNLLDSSWGKGPQPTRLPCPGSLIRLRAGGEISGAIINLD